MKDMLQYQCYKNNINIINTIDSNIIIGQNFNLFVVVETWNYGIFRNTIDIDSCQAVQVCQIGIITLNIIIVLIIKNWINPILQIIISKKDTNNTLIKKKRCIKWFKTKIFAKSILNANYSNTRNMSRMYSLSLQLSWFLRTCFKQPSQFQAYIAGINNQTLLQWFPWRFTTRRKDQFELIKTKSNAFSDNDRWLQSYKLQV